MLNYLKSIFSERKTVFLMLAGIAATVITFVYPAVSVQGDFIIALCLMILDIVLLFVNARVISSLWIKEKENSKMLDTINAFFIMVMYFCLFVILASVFFEEALTMEKIMGALVLAVGLGPSILIVLPILYGIIYILGN
jgi:hypothetical protein